MRESPAVSRRPGFLTERGRILRVEDLTPQERLFEIELEDRPLGHRPCQFVEVSILGVGEAPISVCSSPGSNGTFEICVRKIGAVTTALHRLKAGDLVGIRGPYGNGFPVEKILGKDVLFVGGGLGLAPLRSLIRWSLEHRRSFGRLVTLYGARSSAELLFRRELAAWSQSPEMEFHATVDRPDPGWTGRTGVITTLFPDLTIDPVRTVAVVVGPPVMYKFVILELLKRAVMESRIFVSLERRMRCGLGKCGHCQMNGLYVCQAGPVFCYRDVKKIPEAL